VQQYVKLVMPVKQAHEGAIARVASVESAGATVGATQLQHVLTLQQHTYRMCVLVLFVTRVT
jgi:hypothetical protein